LPEKCGNVGSFLSIIGTFQKTLAIGQVAFSHLSEIAWGVPSIIYEYKKKASWKFLSS
jgi:hypothetical protein